MNDFDLCLEVIWGHVNHWISRKLLEIIGSKGPPIAKWPMGNPVVMWPITSRDPERSNLWPQ